MTWRVVIVQEYEDFTELKFGRRVKLFRKLEESSRTIHDGSSRTVSNKKPPQPAISNAIKARENVKAAKAVVKAAEDNMQDGIVGNKVILLH